MILRVEKRLAYGYKYPVKMALTKCDDCEKNLGWKYWAAVHKAIKERGFNYCYSCRFSGDRSPMRKRAGPNHPLRGFRRPEMSKRFTGKGNPNWGGRYTRKLIREGRLRPPGAFSDFSGPNNPMFGKRRPDLSARNRSNRGKSYHEIYGKKSVEVRLRIRRGIKLSPNNGELFLSKLLPKNVKFTGDRHVWIKLPTKSKNPDFIVTPFPRSKRVIELFGERWHRRSEERWLVAQYKKVGIRCLVVWYRDLKKAEIRKKLEAFCRSA